jgi:hypothetical protein
MSTKPNPTVAELRAYFANAKTDHEVQYAVNNCPWTTAQIKVAIAHLPNKLYMTPPTEIRVIETGSDYVSR